MAREGTYERNWIPARFRRVFATDTGANPVLVSFWCHHLLDFYFLLRLRLLSDFVIFRTSIFLWLRPLEIRRNRDQINDGEDGRRSGPP
nr:hypothetical protein Iba_scaffold10428CG0090 [Ipomoea batatas]GME16537.1 hypothetical protein Iba_scaffold17636CG0030 [Ipomoea batatas]